MKNTAKPQFERRTHRAREALILAGKDYPGAWKAADSFRDQRGPGFDWPAWCFLPLAGAYAVVSGGGSNRVQLDRAGDVARLGALMAWRMTQGIYRFDPAVYDAVSDTPVGGDLPADALMQLPEWCVYIETPGMNISAGTLFGFWAHLEFDMNTGRTELRLLLDVDPAPMAIPLHLGSWSLSESIARAVDAASIQAMAYGMPLAAGGAPREWRSWAEPLVSLLLYVCSVNDFSRRGAPGQPANPTPTRTRRDGMKLFPAEGPREWDVGVRMGAALRAAYQAAETLATGTHAGPRGHVRRAHWHGFRSGPLKREDGSDIPTAERRFDLRWMPPIAVNLPDVDGLPSTVRPVK